jgi:CubicO group peptidase (beta-lactamase class C family)
MRRLTLLHLLAALSCSGADKATKPAAPFPPPRPRAAARAQPRPASRTLSREETLKSLSGATFIVAAGWHVTDHPGGYQALEEPARELTVYLVEPEGVDSAHRAIAAAWKLVQPGFARAVKERAAPPPRSPWDAVTQVIYETTTREARFVLALARRQGRRWYVTLVDGKKAAMDRRAANVLTLIRSLKVPGAKEESWAGRKARPLAGKRLGAFVAFVERARVQAKIPGVAVAVVQGGKVALERGFGVRARGGRAPVTPRTLFMIGSVTKALTSFMMARLVDQKRFAWDTPVIKLMPSFGLADAVATRKLTMQHTVCACTGLPRQDMEFIFEYRGVTPEQRVALMSTMKPTTGFGETFQYSNSMVAAGGYIAARTYGPKLKLAQAYAKAMRDLVFRPLGMRHTRLTVAAARRLEHASPHGMNLKLEVVPTRYTDELAVESVLPAGAAWSCLKDMERYLLVELGRGVTPEGQRLVTERNLLKRRQPYARITDKLHYGLGLMVERVHDVQVVQHGGDTMGYQANMFFLPGHDVGAVVLTNAQTGGAFRRAVQRRLLELLFDGEAKAEKRFAFDLAHLEEVTRKELEQIAFKPDLAWLKRYAGAYRNEGLGRITLAVRRGRGVLDVGEWQSAVGQKREKDGALKLILLDPPWQGLELLPQETKANAALELRVGQHRYRFAKTAR